MVAGDRPLMRPGPRWVARPGAHDLEVVRLGAELSGDLGRAQAFTENMKGGMLTYLHSRTVPLSHRSMAPSQPVPHRRERVAGLSEQRPVVLASRRTPRASVYATVLGVPSSVVGWTVFRACLRPHPRITRAPAMITRFTKNQTKIIIPSTVLLTPA